MNKLLESDQEKRLSAYEVLSELYSANLINLDAATTTTTTTTTNNNNNYNISNNNVDN